MPLHISGMKFMDNEIKKIIDKVNSGEITAEEQAQLSKLFAILHEFFHGDD
jgi:hypothetical protein